MIENNEEQTELVELLRVYARATLNTEKVQSMQRLSSAWGYDDAGSCDCRGVLQPDAGSKMESEL